VPLTLPVGYPYAVFSFIKVGNKIPVFIHINSVTSSQLIINQYSALWPVLAGTRAQSGDRYGSDTLHSGKVFRGSLPLLSPSSQYKQKRLTVSQSIASLLTTGPRHRQTDKHSPLLDFEICHVLNVACNLLRCSPACGV
jgi:hypothetical protein